MTELILKDKIERKKLDALVMFLKSWDIDAEIRTITTKKESKKKLFKETFGMWADRDMDIKEIRQEAYQRRTKHHDNGIL
jgi:hypothetical protein